MFPNVGPDHADDDRTVVGNVCFDQLPNGTMRLGGAAFYACAHLLRLGRRVVLLTSATAGLRMTLEQALPAAEIRCVPSDRDTVFKYDLEVMNKPQSVVSVAHQLDSQDLYPLSPAPILLASTYHDFTLSAIRLIRSVSVMACTIGQGYFRIVRESRLQSDIPSDSILAAMSETDVVVLNRDEWSILESNDRGESLRQVVRTIGALGAEFRKNGKWVRVPAPRIDDIGESSTVIDSVGAGDVFAAQLFDSLACKMSLREAVISANVAGAGHVARRQPRSTLRRLR